MEEQAHGELLAQSQDKPSLSLIREYKLDRQVDTSLMHLGSQERRNILAMRLGCPLFTSFSKREGRKIRIYKLCRQERETPESLHVLWECPTMSRAREDCVLVREVDDISGGRVLFSPTKYAAVAKFLGCCQKERGKYHELEHG